MFDSYTSDNMSEEEPPKITNKEIN